MTAVVPLAVHVAGTSACTIVPLAKSCPFAGIASPPVVLPQREQAAPAALPAVVHVAGTSANGIRSCPSALPSKGVVLIMVCLHVSHTSMGTPSVVQVGCVAQIIWPDTSSVCVTQTCWHGVSASAGIASSTPNANANSAANLQALIVFSLHVLRRPANRLCDKSATASP